MFAAPSLEALLKRDRALVLASLVGLTGLAWIYLVGLAGQMSAMPLAPWTGLHFALMFLMWAVMMVGMMLPSAAPMILLFAMIARKGRGDGHAMSPTGAFMAGYVAVWSGFSLAATTGQWALEQAALLSPAMSSASPALGGLLLMAAGAYQMTPLKDACLKHCRSPVHFLTHHWRTGTVGALRMGLVHGAFCMGCCWVLMGLLFVGGIMNLLWVAAIAAFVLVENLLPFGRRAGRVSGVGLILAGLLVLAGI